MTNKKAIALVLGIMCFALTTGICIQIKTVKSTNSASSQNYEENNLRAEVLKYKEKYDNLLKETEKVDAQLQEQIESATKNNSELEEAKNQINEGNKTIGLAEVTGPGVIITVADSEIDSNSVVDATDFIIHDTDILKIVNELKNAGAEAISINNQRVILTTPIICGGNIININGERIGSPFEIKAIGSPEALANLSRPGGWLSKLEKRGIKVSAIKKSNSITIPKYSGVLNFKYITNISK
ncbi:putative uncharacterized protein [Clostridium sp. CAG:389]|nr:putative uncharacterized protein [Clostridium sp. CAG:389]